MKLLERRTQHQDLTPGLHPLKEVLPQFKQGPVYDYTIYFDDAKQRPFRRMAIAGFITSEAISRQQQIYNYFTEEGICSVTRMRADQVRDIGDIASSQEVAVAENGLLVLPLDINSNR